MERPTTPSPPRRLPRPVWQAESTTRSASNFRRNTSRISRIPSYCLSTGTRASTSPESSGRSLFAKPCVAMWMYRYLANSPDAFSSNSFRSQAFGPRRVKDCSAPSTSAIACTSRRVPGIRAGTAVGSSCRTRVRKDSPGPAVARIGSSGIAFSDFICVRCSCPNGGSARANSERGHFAPFRLTRLRQRMSSVVTEGA